MCHIYYGNICNLLIVSKKTNRQNLFMKNKWSFMPIIDNDGYNKCAKLLLEISVVPTYSA